MQNAIRLNIGTIIMLILSSYLKLFKKLNYKFAGKWLCLLKREKWVRKWRHELIIIHKAQEIKVMNMYKTLFTLGIKKGHIKGIVKFFEFSFFRHDTALIVLLYIETAYT